MRRENLAIILGGGEGRRLFPLTKERSKPAVPVGGKYRLIDIPISNCINSGIRHIYVLTQFNSASLNNHIYQTYRFDSFTNAFIEVLAAEQTYQSNNWFMGTADAVRQNLIHFNIKGNEDIIILSSDHLYHADYQDMLKFHREKNADLTVCSVPIKTSRVKGLGLLKINKSKRITSFLEKPKTLAEAKDFILTAKSIGLNRKKELPEKFCLASMGIYIFKAKHLLRALDSKYLDFGKEVIPTSVNKMKVFSYVFSDYWEDIGTIKAYYDANLNLTKLTPKFNFHKKGQTIYTHSRFLPPAKITNSLIKNAQIAEGCLIKNATIENSIVGLRSVIANGVKIKNSILVGADFYQQELTPAKNTKSPVLGIGEKSHIENAIIDKNVRIGKNVVIKNSGNKKDFDSELFYIRDGIVIIPKNTVIPNNTVIP